MAKLAKDEHYGDPEALIMAYAAALNEELREMKAAGADVLQIDEPYLQPNPEEAERYGVAAIDAAPAGIAVPTVVYPRFGYTPSGKDKPAAYSSLPSPQSGQATPHPTYATH